MLNVVLGTIKNDIWDVDTEMKQWKPKCQLDTFPANNSLAVTWHWTIPGMAERGSWSDGPTATFIQSAYLLDILLWHCHGPVWDLTDRGLLLLSAFQGLGPAYLLPDGAEINSLSEMCTSGEPLGEARPSRQCLPWNWSRKVMRFLAKL